MAVDNKPQDDAKAMTDEYVKGATISFLAAKYNHSEQEVLNTVTKDADAEPLPTQAQEDSQAPVDKKAK